MNSLGSPLNGVNLIAIPDRNELGTEFFITDERGRYKLSLMEPKCVVMLIQDSKLILMGLKFAGAEKLDGQSINKNRLQSGSGQTPFLLQP